jgi:predicted peptidase
VSGVAAQGTKTAKPSAAVYIKGAAENREALRAAVYNYLVKSGRYRMIAVDAIDNVLLKEENRQQNGSVSVSEEQIAKAGKKARAEYVCVVAQVESDGVSYVTTSMVNVETGVAADGQSEMQELKPGAKILDVVRNQINEMLGIDY